MASKAFQILRDCAPTISAGIISADLLSLGSELSLLEKAGLKTVHFDVMDGCFVPALTVGPAFIKGIKTDLLKDVHLMIQNQDEKVADYVAVGADMITIHVEACEDAGRTLRQLGKMENANNPARGIIRGVAINPGTPVEVIEPLLGEVEMVVLLAVDPVKGKHPTMESTRERFAVIKKMTANEDILLCIDGGVKRDNIDEYSTMGSDILVSGSAVFAGNAMENAQSMLGAMKPKSNLGGRSDGCRN